MAILFACAVVVGSHSACAQVATRIMELKDGSSLEYGYVEPADFDPKKEYPVLLALPPGPQTKQMVQASFDLYWNSGGERGWVVVAPVAPKGQFFNRGAEKLIPEFLEKVRERYKPAGGKFHLAGISNGGTSAFRVAGLFTDQFHSLMAMPGCPITDDDKKNLSKLKSFPIALYVGGEDSSWIPRVKEAAAALQKLGAKVELEIVAGQGHVIRGWDDGDKVFKVLGEWHDSVSGKLPVDAKSP